MATGFIYIVTTVNSNYQQKAFCNVPTWWGGRLYFGPCKEGMRPRMEPGDYVFGISGVKPKRVLFAAKIERVMTFREAYHAYPDLQGPKGPVHVKPVGASGYEHILGACHADRWKDDIYPLKQRDRFFVLNRPAGKAGCFLGQWLGKSGPALDDGLLRFLQGLPVYGRNGLRLRPRNDQATLDKPIRHGDRFIGLHLETDRPERLLELCEDRMRGKKPPFGPAVRCPPPSEPRTGSGQKKSRRC